MTNEQTFGQFLDTLNIKTQRSSKKEIDRTMSIVVKKEPGVCDEKRTGVNWFYFAAAGIAVAAGIAFAVVNLSGVLNIPYKPQGSVVINSPAIHEDMTTNVLCAKAVRVGDWIYYLNPSDSYSLYKIEQSDDSENVGVVIVFCRRIVGKVSFGT